MLEKGKERVAALPQMLKSERRFSAPFCPLLGRRQDAWKWKRSQEGSAGLFLCPQTIASCNSWLVPSRCVQTTGAGVW